MKPFNLTLCPLVHVCPVVESVEYEAKRRTYLEKHGPMQVYDKQKESDIGIFSLEIDEETDLELEYIDDQAIVS